MSDVLTVRRLGHEDWQALRDMRREMLADAPDWFWTTLADVEPWGEQEWRAALSGGRAYLLAERGAEPVGLLGIDWVGYTEDLRLDADTVNIVSVYVRPAHRGSGVLGALLAAADEEVRAAGRCRQLLETPEDNLRARRAYERLGFRETGHRAPDPRRAGLQEVEYARMLA